MKGEESGEIIFEESEVIWAKIRGYPWWPAYVSDVYDAETPSDYEYTIIFFGDNTNSRLGPTKIRKFLQNYAEFYKYAKANKRLRQAVEKAEERLKENSQDVSFYESVRSEMKTKKKKQGVQENREKDFEKEERAKKLELTKQKKGSKKGEQKEELFEEEESEVAGEDVEEAPSEKVQSSGRDLRSRKRKRENLNQQQEWEQKICLVAKRSGRKEKKTRVDCRKESEDEMQAEEEVEEGVEEGVEEQGEEKCESPHKSKIKSQLQQQSQMKQQSSLKSPAKPKRGRPAKKNQITSNNQRLKKEETSNFFEDIEPPKEAKVNKRGGKKVVEKAAENTDEQGLSQKQLALISSSIRNHKQLTKILLEMPINPSNVKQILDLGVSHSLQETATNKHIYLILCTLKAALLHKYFPDDNKYRKKYEKITKEKKKAASRSDDEDDEANAESDNDSEQMKNEGNSKKQQKIEKVMTTRNQHERESEMKNKKKNLEREELNHQKQLREKVLQKLQKMLRKAGIQEQSRELSQKYESLFDDECTKNGKSYREVAYQRLRELKTRLSGLAEEKVKREKIKGLIVQYVDRGVLRSD